MLCLEGMHRIQECGDSVSVHFLCWSVCREGCLYKIAIISFAERTSHFIPARACLTKHNCPAHPNESKSSLKQIEFLTSKSNNESVQHCHADIPFLVSCIVFPAR